MNEETLYEEMERHNLTWNDVNELLEEMERR